MNAAKTKWLIQVSEDRGEWRTIARRSDYAAACRLAKKERTGERRETSVIRDGDPPILRRCTANGFDLC